jgi:hypothetical protein
VKKTTFIIENCESGVTEKGGDLQKRRGEWIRCDGITSLHPHQAVLIAKPIEVPPEA